MFCHALRTRPLPRPRSCLSKKLFVFFVSGTRGSPQRNVSEVIFAPRGFFYLGVIPHAERRPSRFSANSNPLYSFPVVFCLRPRCVSEVCLIFILTGVASGMPRLSTVLRPLSRSLSTVFHYVFILLYRLINKKLTLVDKLRRVINNLSTYVSMLISLLIALITSPLSKHQKKSIIYTRDQPESRYLSQDQVGPARSGAFAESCRERSRLSAVGFVDV